ncbi:hypothetical protein DFH27DRAFT_349962 [Peziza echinospora]|nr:hypothetical protein DFH27DRAFT_349962 [Peziza echinospora]
MPYGADSSHTGLILVTSFSVVSGHGCAACTASSKLSSSHSPTRPPPFLHHIPHSALIESTSLLRPPHSTPPHPRLSIDNTASYTYPFPPTPSPACLLLHLHLLCFALLRHTQTCHYSLDSTLHFFWKLVKRHSPSSFSELECCLVFRLVSESSLPHILVSFNIHRDPSIRDYIHPYYTLPALRINLPYLPSRFSTDHLHHQVP